MRVLVLCGEQDVAEDVINSLKTSYSDLEVITSTRLDLTDMDKINGRALDMAIIDLDIEIDTFDVIKGIRSFSKAVIIGICSKKNKNEMLKALNAGADQCMVKPFGHDEFIARAKAMLRIKRAGVTKPIG